MSIEYVRAVLELEDPVGLQRLLLVALAEHADRNGVAEPGNQCLAAETKISERQIQRMIPELEAAGLLQTVQTGNGRGKRRTVRLLFAPASLTKRVTLEPERVTSETKQEEKRVTSERERVTSERERVTNGTEKGDMAPEVEADNPINPINPKEPMGVDLPDQTAQAREATPIALPPLTQSPTKTQPKPPAQGKVYPLRRPAVVQSTYLREPRKFQRGYIPAGQGANAVEVYYESFSIQEERMRLSAPLEDDLVRHCPDLERLRQVCQAYRQHGQYAPRNLKLIFDWYDRGVPERGGKATGKSYEPEYDFSGYQAKLILPTAGPNSG